MLLKFERVITSKNMANTQSHNVEHKSAEPINFALRDHQKNAKDWGFKELTTDLHTWAERLILDFKIESEGVPALMVNRLRRNRLGHYCVGRNGFGINDEIAIDESHIQAGPYWEVLGTLLHEILHLWQKHNGKSPGPNSHNYHNKQYREKALSLGLIVDQYGHTQYAPGSTPFLNLLKKYKFQVPEIPKPNFAKTQRSNSSLQLYECSCGVKVRIGRSRFNAKCLDCNTCFVLKEL